MPRKEIEISETDVVNYILKHKTSLRKTAEYFGCGKDLIRKKIKSYNGVHKEEIENILLENLKKSRF